MSKYSLMKNGNIKITLKVKLTRQSGRTRIFDAQEKKIDIRTVAAFAKARRWQQWIDEGRFSSTLELAKHLGMDSSYIARTIRLNNVSPRIVRSFINGTAPSGLSLTKLIQPLPASWVDQEKMFGYPMV